MIQCLAHVCGLFYPKNKGIAVLFLPFYVIGTYKYIIKLPVTAPNLCFQCNNRFEEFDSYLGHI